MPCREEGCGGRRMRNEEFRRLSLPGEVPLLISSQKEGRASACRFPEESRPLPRPLSSPPPRGASRAPSVGLTRGPGELLGAQGLMGLRSEGRGGGRKLALGWERVQGSQTALGKRVNWNFMQMSWDWGLGKAGENRSEGCWTS